MLSWLDHSLQHLCLPTNNANLTSQIWPIKIKRSHQIYWWDFFFLMMFLVHFASLISPPETIPLAFYSLLLAYMVSGWHSHQVQEIPPFLIRASPGSHEITVIIPHLLEFYHLLAGLVAVSRIPEPCSLLQGKSSLLIPVRSAPDSCGQGLNVSKPRHFPSLGGKEGSSAQTSTETPQVMVCQSIL